MDKTLVAPLKHISRYRIESILGSGAMGMVYLAHDTQIERDVAIKVLHPHLRLGDNGEDFQQRFIQEAKAAARCLHTNIVTIFDFGTVDDASFIVMEYVKGTELKAHLRNNTAISLASATDICIQILSALGHAHDNGVTHRDVKPANIMLLEDGSVKVSDFGVARLDSSDLTGTGYMVGTPNYMSPEGLSGQTVDSRSDLYSVGVIFYELLTNTRPERDIPINENLSKLDRIALLSPQNIRSLKPILSRALQKAPSARYQKAEDFIADLKNIDDMDLSETLTNHFPTLANPYQNDAATKMNTSSPSQWSDEVLVSIEHSLTKHMGPVAKLLIKKHSKVSGSIEELVSVLTQHIPNEGERSQFMKALERTGITTANTSGLTSTAGLESSAVAGTQNTLSPAAQKKITQTLAFYIGPLAGRLIKNVMKSNAEPSVMIMHLAQQIPDERERKEFMDKAGRYI